MQKAAHRAVAAYLERLESTLGLLGPLSILHQPQTRDAGAIAVRTHDVLTDRSLQDALASPIPLHNADGEIDLILYISLSYRVSRHIASGVSWHVHQGPYLYRICDCSKRSLLEFHFHPSGRSWHTGYHAHASLATGIELHSVGHPERITRELHGRKFHIPTSEIVAEDIVDLLRNDFGVRLTERDPRRVDRLLASNREARRQAP